MRKIKEQKIKILTKKHPTWENIFLKWLNNDENINMDTLEYSFKLLLANKQALKSDINVGFAINLIDIVKIDDNAHRDIVEHFNDEIQKTLHKKHKSQFIRSLKTKKYKHLFNRQIENEINIILDNKISISALKHQFFKKLAFFNNDDELMKSIQNFKSKNINWNKSYYLEVIKHLNVEVINNHNNTLTLLVKDYVACKTLGSQAWCIVQKEHYWQNYTEDSARQFIHLNFNLPIENNESLIGYTVDIIGNVIHSYLKNDTLSPRHIKNKFKFRMMNDEELFRYLNSLSNQNAFGEICKYGLIKYYDDFIQRKNVDPSFNNNYAYSVASESGNVSILVKLLSDKRVDPTYNSKKDLMYAAQHGKIHVLDIFLKDSRFDNAENKNRAFIGAVEYGQTESVLQLLNDESVNPGFDNNIAFIYAACYGYIDIINALLADDRVNPSDDNNKAFQSAARNGNLKIVQRLLKETRIDPTARNNLAVKLAAESQHCDVLQCLLSNEKIYNSLSLYEIKELCINSDIASCGCELVF